MVLHRKNRERRVAQAFDRVVVEIDLGDFRARFFERVRVGGETVVLRGETLPVSRFFTGWLPPRWPNLSLNVVPPSACVIIWCPRQIPKIGKSGSRFVTVW